MRRPSDRQRGAASLTTALVVAGALGLAVGVGMSVLSGTVKEVRAAKAHAAAQDAALSAAQLAATLITSGVLVQDSAPSGTVALKTGFTPAAASWSFAPSGSGATLTVQTCPAFDLGSSQLAALYKDGGTLPAGACTPMTTTVTFVGKDSPPLHEIARIKATYTDQGGPTRTLAYSALLPLPNVAAPPRVSITANGATGSVRIAYRGSATIQWASTDATSCSVRPTFWAGLSGTKSTGALATTTTYRVTCRNAAGSASDTVVVRVPAPPAPSVCGCCELSLRCFLNVTILCNPACATYCGSCLRGISCPLACVNCEMYGTQCRDGSWFTGYR